MKYAGSTTRWAVYHRSLGTGKFLNLDDTAATVTQNDHWQTAPNATQFTVETNGENVNNSGDSYVAHLFAHNDTMTVALVNLEIRILSSVGVILVMLALNLLH
ncbi:MAG: hypothetical protein CM15mV133_130 [uncultured marine virus]|nr:MAG: hypothetical protein CM15mV133_130 [uncultured marine virus]